MEITTNSAFLLITCNVGKLDDVISQIKPLDDIKEIHGTCGAYDIIAKVESTTSEILNKFILEKIRTLDDVQSSMTLQCNPNFR